MIRIVVPWPPKQLSPNGRYHWRVVAPIKKKFKEDCFYQAQQQRTPDFGKSNVAVYILAFPKTNRFDLDNIGAMLKYGLDGIAQAWEINDKIFRPVTTDFGGVDKQNPHVEILFKVLDNRNDLLSVPG